MEIENINIYDLVPIQISTLIEKLQVALEIVKTRKQTKSNVAIYEIDEEKHRCIYCHGYNIIKYGHDKNGTQTYKCKDCSKRFNALSNTVISKTHLSYKQIEIFLECFRDKISIRKTAKRMNVNKKTVHLLRLKMMDSLKEIRENIKLEGEIECDEHYESINLKGTKPSKMPRASKKRTSQGTSLRGISSHKVCIESAIDEHDNMFLEIVGTGPITSEMVKESLTPKLGAVKTLVTDCKSSYESEAKANSWNLKQVKSNCHVDSEGNNLANINNLHSGLSNFLSRFKGVSTKHLQGYLDWYAFDRYLNYSFEEDKKVEKILNSVINRSTDITISNAYDNSSGIDFSKIYSDYDYSPSAS